MHRNRTLGFPAIAILSFVLGHSIATAQPQSPDLPPPPSASAEVARQVNLTPEEQLAETDSVLTHMESGRLMIRRMLQAARSRRDHVKTACLNDKLNQMDVALRSTRERRQTLEVAATRKDVDAANHEFSIVNVLRQRTSQLTADANLCIGDDPKPPPVNGNTSSVDPGLPEEDPSEYPLAPIIAEPPTCSSCFL
jgi:hypothetical protein